MLGAKLYPLKSLSYKVEVQAVYCHVLMQLTFKSKESDITSPTFNFNLPVEATFDSFHSKTDIDTIDSKIESKKKGADYSYKKSSRQESREKPNNINMCIGKLEPGKLAVIDISYYQLSAFIQDGWCIVLPYMYAYFAYDQEQEIISELLKERKTLPTSSAVICIRTVTKITEIVSKTHKINTEYNSDYNEANISFEKCSTPNFSSLKECNDVWNSMLGVYQIKYKYARMETPVLLYEDIADKGEYAYGVCFAPGIDTPIDKTAKTVKGQTEYVFLLDTSGSMSGDKIEMAKQSLMLLIKSLPIGCKFNCISFNTSYKEFAPESQEYSQKIVDKTIEMISEIKSSGGTDILSPLTKAYSREVNPDFPRVIFLITDGEVEDKDKVLEIINKHSHNTIVNSLGIGRDVDKSLISKTATAGNGKYWIVESSHDIAETVIEMLDYSTLRAFTNISIKSHYQPKIFWSSLKNTKICFQGNAVSSCAIFGSKISHTVISYFDTTNKENVMHKYQHSELPLLNCKCLGKLIASNCIREVKHNEFKSIEGLGEKYSCLSATTCICASIMPTIVSANPRIRKDQNDSSSSDEEKRVKYNTKQKKQSDEDSDEQKEKDYYSKRHVMKMGKNYKDKEDSSDEEVIKKHSKCVKKISKEKSDSESNSDSEKFNKRTKKDRKIKKRKNNSSDEELDSDEKEELKIKKDKADKKKAIKKEAKRKKRKNSDDDEEENENENEKNDSDSEKIHNSDIEDKKSSDSPNEEECEDNDDNSSDEENDTKKGKTDTAPKTTEAEKKLEDGKNATPSPLAMLNTIRTPVSNMIVSVAKPEDNKIDTPNNNSKPVEIKVAAPTNGILFAPIESALTQFITTHADLDKIVMDQSISGCWSQSTLQFVLAKGKDMQEFEAAIPEQLKPLKNAVGIWCTIILLELLIKAAKKEHSLIIRKAIDYLKENGIDYSIMVKSITA